MELRSAEEASILSRNNIIKLMEQKRLKEEQENKIKEETVLK